MTDTTRPPGVSIHSQVEAALSGQLPDRMWYCPDPPYCEPGNPCSESCGYPIGSFKAPGPGTRRDEVVA